MIVIETFTSPATYEEFDDRYPRHIAKYVQRHYPAATEEQRREVEQKLIVDAIDAIPRLRNAATIEWFFFRLNMVFALARSR